MIKVLHNQTCSKSRGLVAYLEENGVDFEIRDIIAEPLTVTDLKEVLMMLGTTVEDIIRKNDSHYQENYADARFSEEQWLQILVDSPTLIQRPIVIKESKAIIARPLEVIEQLIRCD